MAAHRTLFRLVLSLFLLGWLCCFSRAEVLFPSSQAESTSNGFTLPDDEQTYARMEATLKPAFSYSRKHGGTYALWGITVLFNLNAAMMDTYNRWYDSVHKQGLQVLLIQAVRRGQTPAMLPADLFMRHVIGDNTIISKETLLNVALENLPETCDKVVWIDPDTIMTNEYWVAQTVVALEKYPIVQPFSFYTTLPPGVTAIDETTSVFLSAAPFQPGGLIHSYALALRVLGNHTAMFADLRYVGFTGGVWAAQRSVLERMRFFDGFILGGGDIAFAGALCGVSPEVMPLLGSGGRDAVRTWRRLVGYVNRVNSIVQCNVGVLPGLALHLHHGADERGLSSMDRYEPLLTVHESIMHTRAHDPFWDLNPAAFEHKITPAVTAFQTSRYTAFTKGITELHSFWRYDAPKCPWSEAMWASYQKIYANLVLPKSPADLDAGLVTSPMVAVATQAAAGGAPDTQSGPPAVVFAPGGGLGAEPGMEFNAEEGGQQLCGITAYLNVQRHTASATRFRQFRARSRAQGLFLITVEVALMDQPFDLTARDSDVLIPIHHYAAEEPVYKEQMWNIAVEQLPRHCRYVVWLDGDVLFTNDNWVAETVAALQTHTIVQPFAFAIQLPCWKDWLDPVSVLLWNGEMMDRPLAMHHSLGFGLHVRPLKKKRMDYAFCASQPVRGHSGYAWATSVELLRKAGGLFDIGAGIWTDTLMALAHFYPFCQPAAFEAVLRLLPDPVVSKFKQRAPLWSSVFQGKLGYVNGFIYRLWAAGSTTTTGDVGDRPSVAIGAGVTQCSVFALPEEQQKMKLLWQSAAATAAGGNGGSSLSSRSSSIPRSPRLPNTRNSIMSLDGFPSLAMFRPPANQGAGTSAAGHFTPFGQTSSTIRHRGGLDMGFGDFPLLGEDRIAEPSRKTVARKPMTAEELKQIKCPEWKPTWCVFHCSYRKWVWDEYRVRELAARPGAGKLIVKWPEASRLTIPFALKHGSLAATAAVQYCLTFIGSSPSGVMGSAAQFQRAGVGLFTKRCSAPLITDDMLWVLLKGKLISMFWSPKTAVLRRCLTCSATTQWTLALAPCGAMEEKEGSWALTGTGQLQFTFVNGTSKCLRGVSPGPIHLSDDCSNTATGTWLSELVHTATKE